MSRENGESDPLIRRLGERWLPIESIVFWREFQKKWPAAAEVVRGSAHAATTALINRSKK